MTANGIIGGFKSLLDDSFIFDRLTEKDYPKFVTKTIQLLGANSGLRLIFAEKFTDSCFNQKTKVVSIPAPPAFPRRDKKDNKKSYDTKKNAFFTLLSEWRGVLNHEVGHAQFTIWAAEKEANFENQQYDIKNHKFADLFENGRMERVACEKYPA